MRKRKGSCFSNNQQIGYIPTIQPALLQHSEFSSPLLIVEHIETTINTHYDTVTKNANHHAHPPSTIRVKAEVVLIITKERCMKETTPIPTICEEERAKLRSLEYMGVNPDHDDVIAELPTYYEKRMSLYRARRKETPLLPITRIDVNLDGKWTKTSAGNSYSSQTTAMEKKS
ncbi:unnamed protein product [Mytilus coruscus]|uniref:Uncharacterized protein n=1 Tax=Mytilus coruscus TaxID=42192 RepID=A0A6J8CHA2_MYTCO|nr:unnamed protein product [Mytilus coruscus]